MSGFRRVISVLAYWMGGGTQREHVQSGPGPQTSPGVIRWETTTGPGRGVGRPDQQCLQTPTPNDYNGHSATGGPMLFGDCPVR